MGIKRDKTEMRRIADKARGMFADFDKDIALVGEVAAEAIVRTTLAGIGEADSSFAAYSQAYKTVIEAVGGKPQQTVNLRGLFYHAGQKRVKFRSEKQRLRYREGRQAYVQVTFMMARRARKMLGVGSRGGRNIFRTLSMMGGRSKSGGKGLALFQAKTGITRPARGVVDTLSEMSLDLISVTATMDKLTLTYTPRQKPYMIYHNEGRTPQPQRKWYTINKAAVKAAMVKVMEMCLEARALQFNLSSVTVIRSARGVVGEAIKRELGN